MRLRSRQDRDFGAASMAAWIARTWAATSWPAPGSGPVGFGAAMLAAGEAGPAVRAVRLVERIRARTGGMVRPGAAEPGRLRAGCAAAGLTLHSTFTGLAAYWSNLLLHPDSAARERARSWYRRAVDFTATAALDASGATEVALIIEVIPPFEQDDDEVLSGLRQSAEYWRDALAGHAR